MSMFLAVCACVLALVGWKRDSMPLTVAAIAAVGLSLVFA